MKDEKFTIRIQEAHEVGHTGKGMKLSGATSEDETIEELKISMTKVIELVLKSLEEQAKKDRKLFIEIPN